MKSASKKIPFYVPWISKEDEKAVSRALRSRWLTGGPRARDFEGMFADYLGTRFAVSVSSCTAALHLAMRVLKIGPGDEVIVPVFTFASTANAPLFCGAKPVFVDIDEKTFNISPEDVTRKITRKTRAIIPVHYGGQPCDMKEIQEIAEDGKIHMVEDCAHSLGAVYDGKKAGSLSTMGCFSFYPTKIITTLEGGMITTDDEQTARRLKLLREHGMTKSASERESDETWFYDVTELGYNCRLNEIQAALGISQLNRVEKGIQKRVEAARFYTKLLNACGLATPYEAPHRTHIFHLYAIRIIREKAGITRNELFKRLANRGIGVSVHYTPLHLLSFYRKLLKNKRLEFPVAERVYEQVLSLPIYPTITREAIRYVAGAIREGIEQSQ